MYTEFNKLYKYSFYELHVIMYSEVHVVYNIAIIKRKLGKLKRWAWKVQGMEGEHSRARSWPFITLYSAFCVAFRAEYAPLPRAFYILDEA